MKLTKREVTLLFLLAVVAMVYFGINYLILPEYKINLEKQNSIASLNDQLINLNINGKTDLDALMNEAKVKSADLSKPFSSSIDPEQIDYWINTLLKQNGLTKISSAYMDLTPANPDFITDTALADSDAELPLAIQNAVNTITGVSNAGTSAAASAAPAPASGASAQTSENINGTAETANTNSENIEPPVSGLYCTQLVLNAVGSYDNISKFMDALYAGGRSFVVDSFTVSDNPNSTAGGKLAVVTIRFFGAPLVDESTAQAYDFPTPQGQSSLMNETPAPTPTPSASPSPSASPES